MLEEEQVWPIASLMWLKEELRLSGLLVGKVSVFKESLLTIKFGGEGGELKIGMELFSELILSIWFWFWFSIFFSTLKESWLGIWKGEERRDEDKIGDEIKGEGGGKEIKEELEARECMEQEQLLFVNIESVMEDSLSVESSFIKESVERDVESDRVIVLLLDREQEESEEGGGLLW